MTGIPEGYMKYGEFTEAGIVVAAFYPSQSPPPVHWLVIYSRDGEELRREQIDMSYDPIFGPDVDDVANLNRHADAMLAELKWQ